jgi:hypothetical protein
MAQRGRKSHGEIWPVPVHERVPERWRSFHVSRQSSEDYACGLHCILSATNWLLRSAPGVQGSQLLGLLSSRESRNIEQRMQDGPGLESSHVRMLAHAAGLSVYQPRMQHLGQFSVGDLWMLMVRYTFPSPSGPAQSAPDNHYILVLDYLADAGLLVIADPHAARPALYCLGGADLVRAWKWCSKSRGRRLLWGARLSAMRHNQS